MSYKLRVGEIVANSLYIAWNEKEVFLKAISFPTLFLVLIGALWNVYSENIGIYIGFLAFFVYGVSFSLFAVTCHRLILVRNSDTYRGFNFRVGIRELKFLGMVILVYGIVQFLEGIPITIAVNINDSFYFTDEEDRYYWISLLLSVPALYVLGRLSLVFPATAIDRKVSLKWSWVVTRGNGWRMFIIVGLFPWLLTLAVWLLWRENATVLEKTTLSIASYFGLAIEVFLLSLTYREFESYHSGES